jgi:hypothetical protein
MAKMSVQVILLIVLITVTKCTEGASTMVRKKKWDSIQRECLDV